MKPTIFAVVVCLLLSAAARADEASDFFIEGYAGQVSVGQTEEVTLHVSTSAPVFDVEIARLGSEQKVVYRKKGVVGHSYPIPEDASASGCRWPEAMRVKVPAEWTSGFYSVKFHIEDKGGKFTHRARRTAESSAWFIVRPAPGSEGKTSKILLQLCTNTYNAYTNWGGFSLYFYSGYSKNQGHRVSFDRPVSPQYEKWELPFVVWAEKNGYTLEYAANGDMEARPEILDKYKLVLSVGHDEYWSGKMRDALEAFIGRGGNVAFFSGNSVCWQVRTEDDGRALTCWKQWYNMDPVWQQADKTTLSTAWSHYLVNRPENQLTGVGFLWGGYRKSHGQFMEEPAEFTVHRPEHWVFAGTGLKRGGVFGAKDTIVGYECDGCELVWKDGLPFATHKDGTPETFEVLCTCPAKWHPDDAEWYERYEKGRVGNAVMGVYTRGGTVFTAGTTDWSHGLRGGDKAVDRITRNILDRLAK